MFSFCINFVYILNTAASCYRGYMNIRFTCSSCHISIKLEFSEQIFEKYLSIKFYENPFFGSRVFYLRTVGRSDGIPTRKDMTKLIVAFRNFANAPKIYYITSVLNVIVLLLSLLSLTLILLMWRIW